MRQLYTTEANLVIRKAHKLNVKTLYPSSLKRQSVDLVLNIFDQTTLECFEEDQKQIANFIKIIRQWWWCIVNSTQILKTNGF